MKLFFIFYILCCVLWIAIQFPAVSARVEFTNIKCDSLDKSFADFEYCYIKAVNRSYKYISLKVNLFRVHITKIKINLATMQRLNGYKPFLYNITVDACRFYENPQRNPIAQYLFSLFTPFSNINHTCPYENDVFVEKLPISYLDNQFTKILPVPPGDYGFYSSWIAYDKNRANVNVYVTLT